MTVAHLTLRARRTTSCVSRRAAWIPMAVPSNLALWRCNAQPVCHYRVYFSWAGRAVPACLLPLNVKYFTGDSGCVIFLPSVVKL